MKPKFASLFVASSSIFVSLSGMASAGNQTWKASPTDANWATITNWAGGAAPGALNANSTDVATFNTALSGGIGGTGNPIVIDSTRNIGSILFDTASVGAYQIGTNGGNTLTIGSTTTVLGSIKLNAAVTNAQIIAANLQMKRLTSSQQVVYNFVNNATSSAATLTLSGTIDMRTDTNRFSTFFLDGTNTGNNTISGIITTGAGTSSAGQGNQLLVKQGTGRWILSGANAFSGAGITNVAQGINVNAGTLVAGNNGAFGTTATANNNQVNINSGGTVEIANGIVLDNGVSLNLNNGGTVGGVGTATTNGRVNVGTAAGTSVTLTTASSSDVFTLGNAGANDFTGGAADSVTHIAGPGTVVNSASSTAYLGSIAIDAGAFRTSSATNGAGVAGVVTFGSGSTGKLQLGNSLSLTSLTTNGATPTAGIVETGVAGTQTLTLTPGSASTYAGTLRNGTGTLALTKAGSNTLTLSGNSNTYSGATTISAGTLKVTNTSGSATGTSTVGLGTATLTGAGIITGAVTAVSTSTLTPGTVTAGLAGSGVLTLGSLTLVSGTNLNYGLVSTGNTPNSNNYISTGALTLPTSGVVLNLYTPGTSNPFAAAGVYNLFQFTSLPGVALSNSTFTFGTSIAGYNASFGTSAGFLQLTLAQAGALATWTNGGATGNWSLAGNWSGTGTLPPQAAGDSATFGATAPGTVNLDANETVGGLTFNNASAFTLSSSNSSTLTLDNTGSGVTITATTGSHAIQTALAFNDSVTVATASGTQLSIAGNISEVSGTRSLTKTGSGTLVLSGTNAYSGGTSINAGVLEFSSLGSLGTGTTLALGAAATNGTLRYASGNTADVSGLTVTLNVGGGTIDTNANNVTFANAIGNSGTGGLTKTGTGTLTLAGANTYTGTTTINNGTLSVASNANLGPAATAAQLIFTGTGGTLATSASFGLFNGAAGTNDRPIALSGTDGTLAPATGTTLTLSGAITGAGKLIKSDAGQVTIQNATSGQNTFSGGTLVSAGTIAMADANANAQGLGTGTVTLDGGTVKLFSYANLATDAGNFANNIVVNSGQTGTLIAMARGTIGGSLTGSGTLNYQTDYVRAQVNGNWSGFTGQINVTPNTNGGDFRLITTAGFGTAKINLANGVTMYMQTNFAAGGLTNSIGELTGGATSFLRGGPTGGRTMTWSVGSANTIAQFDGSIQDGTGATAITKVGTGTWTLAGTNNYTGATLISGGALQIGAGGTTGTLGTAAVTNNATLIFNRSNAISIGNAITGSGSLVQLGTGQTTLSATNSAASLITRFGETVISGNTTATNFVSVGSINGDSGTLTVQTGGTLTATAGAGDINVGDNHGSTGILNLTGGSITSTNLSIGKNFDNVAGTTTGTVNQSGSSTFTVNGANGVILANNTGGVGTYNLNGGTLIAKQVSQGTGASGTFNFNGGTLQAGGASGTFMTGLTAANVQAGGANIDDGGFAVTIGQALIHDPALGVTPDGGLTKSGSGTLTLTGTSTYTGATTVSAGSLLVNGALGNTAVTVSGSATLGGTGSIAGTVSIGGTGTLSAGASIQSLSSGSLSMTSGTTFAYEVLNNGSTGADLMAVDGTLSLASVTLGLDSTSLTALASGSFLTNDKITLISYEYNGSTEVTSGFTGYTDDTDYTFGLNQWHFDYNDLVAGGNFATDAVAGGQDRFVTMTLVPEPSTALLGGLGVLALLRRRRR